MNKKKIIIDTDCGSDDAMAISMALNDPRYEVLMISTVSGNVSVNQATQNTLYTIKQAETYQPPVYMGATECLLRTMSFAHDIHGVDGMSGITKEIEYQAPSEGNGVVKLVEALNSNEPGEIDVIAIGPLTNIALAIKLDPKAMAKIGRLIIMGSSGLGVGNASPVAEFNIWQDPEAAKIVCESGLENIVFVGWDASLGDAVLNKQDIEKIKNTNQLGSFTINASNDLLNLNKERFNDEVLDMADPAAMAVALNPECIKTMNKYYCEVDTSNGPSYGSLVVDRTNILNRTPNAYICSELDAEKYKAYLFDTLGKVYVNN